MPEIIPRWEWRCFGTHFGPATSMLEFYSAKLRHEGLTG